MHIKNNQTVDWSSEFVWLASTDQINEIVNKKGFAKKGDMVINLASMPVKESGMVNTLKISEIK